ncbi:Hemolysin, contains CBS domains [Thermoflavimicrobium dichotomicum]|uniref:Hemolysin, contains CBS domains n=1 Tax=Thermoflavimicrobium dichotomicum TaxID=46223 RepID=A0A1I3MQ26_9BACL|nr:Hemolysin, contains CBS domains [Thermoflavimicrobium dichotomicum]
MQLNEFRILFDIVLIIFLVFLNGFFVASEFAIVKVRSTRIAQLTEQGNVRAQTAQKLILNLDAYLSATQLGITLASLGLGYVGEPALAKILEPVLHFFHLPSTLVHVLSFSFAFAFITFLHIVLGEMAPKSIAIRQAETTTLWIARPLHFFFVLFKPAIWILNRSANFILKMFGVKLEPDHQQAHTEEEIRMLVEQSHRSGIIDQTELSLLDNIFDFTDRVGREVMVPRIKMVCLYAHEPFAKNLEVINETHYTRFPLCGRDKDDILGIVHIRDIYEKLAMGKVPDLQEIVRPAVLVPETMEIKDILRTLQKHRTEMAIVVDEYGGTSGLVTMEDIIEEIVGEIQDEFDDERPFFQQKGNETSIDARLLIEEVNDFFQLDIEDENNDTIGGWIFSQLQAVPKVGAEVSYKNYLFIVQEMDQRSITRILVKPIEQKQP